MKVQKFIGWAICGGNGVVLVGTEWRRHIYYSREAAEKALAKIHTAGPAVVKPVRVSGAALAKMEGGGNDTGRL